MSFVVYNIDLRATVEDSYCHNDEKNGGHIVSGEDCNVIIDDIFGEFNVSSKVCKRGNIIRLQVRILNVPRDFSSRRCSLLIRNTKWNFSGVKLSPRKISVSIV